MRCAHGTDTNLKSQISVFSTQAPERRLGVVAIRDFLQILEHNVATFVTSWTESPQPLQVRDADDAHQLASLFQI